MPSYDIQDSSGKVILTLEGDAPPTDADVDEALSIQGGMQLGSQLKAEVANAELQAKQFSRSLSGIDDPVINPNLPQRRIDELPELQQNVPYFGGFRGMVTPEEERARVMANWKKIPLGDEMVHPTLGRIKKTGGFSFQQLNPDEQAGFLDSAATAGQIVRNLPSRLAIGLGAGLAADQGAVQEQLGGIAQDLETYKKPAEQVARTTGAAASRVLSPIAAVGLAPYTGGGSLALLAGGGIAGEALAEKIEGRDLNPIEIGVAGLTAPIGFSNLKAGAGLGRSLLKGAGEGALIGGANIGARKLDDIIQGREVNFGQDDLTQLGLTTAFGGLARGAEKTVNKGMEILNKTKEAPPMANVATQNAANIGGDTNALQASLNQVTTPSPIQQSAGVFEQELKQQDISQKVQKALGLQETNKAVQKQLAEIDTATKLRQSQEGADQLREQLALEQATAERAAIQQERQLADIQAEEVAFPELQENFPELSPQAQRMYDDYGRITPGVLPMLASGAAGGVGGSAYGATQGENPEERMTNALRYGGIGLVGGPALTALGQAAYRGLTRPRARAFTGAMEPQMLDDIVPVESGSLGEAPAVFRGVQEGLPARGVPDIELFNLTQEIPGHPAGSTVSRGTLEAAGYTVPDLRTPESKIASLSDEIVEPTPREFPKDIEFLYRQNLPTREGGEKAVNYFQVDKTPENPRGLTVDDAVLMERGYSQEQITKMADDLISGRGSPFIGGKDSGAIINPLTIIAEARKRLNARKVVQQAPANSPVNLPEVDSEQYIKQTAEKMIRDRNNPLQMRQIMSGSEDIIGQKFHPTALEDAYGPMTIDEVRTVVANPALSRNERMTANAVLLNKLRAAGESVESARIAFDLTNTFSDAATVMNIAKILKSPDDYAQLLDDQIFAINGRNLSQADRDVVTDLARKRLAAQDGVEAAHRNFIKNPDSAAEKAFKDSELNLGKAEREIALKEASLLPKKWGDALTGPIKTGLLGARTITFGAAANIGQYAIDNTVDSLATIIDAARAKVTGGERAVMSLNPLPSPGEMKRSASVLARNIGELFTGSNVRSFSEGIGSVGAKPIEDIKQGVGMGKSMAVKRETIIDPVTGDKTNIEYVPLPDRAARFFRGVTGLPVGPMQRLISLTDNAPRQGRDYRLLREQGKLRGLKGEELRQFMVAPPSDAAEAASKIAARTVLQDNAYATKVVSGMAGVARTELKKLSRLAKSDWGKSYFNQADQLLAVLQTTQHPFVTIPINSVDRLLTMGFFPYGVMKALSYSAQGNTAMAERVIAEMAIGGGIIGVGTWLYRNGLASEPNIKDPKERSIAYATLGGPGKVNISGVKRLLDSGNKEDARWRQGDTVFDYTQITNAGGVLALAIKAASLGREKKKEPETMADRGMEKAGFMWDMFTGSPGVAMNMSPLMNASAMIDALANSEDPDKMGRWAFNTMRAFVSPILPRTLDDFASIKYGDMPQLRDNDSIVNSLTNLVKYKTQQLDEKDIVFSRDLWGRKIDAARGMDKYYAAFVDPFKAKVLKADPWEIEIAKAYEESGFNPDAYPSIPSARVDLLGQTYKLDMKDAERIAAERGRLYRKELKELVNNPKWQRLKPQAKVLVLNKIYSKVNAKHGAMVRQNPVFIEKYEGKVERKTTQRLAIEEAINK